MPVYIQKRRWVMNIKIFTIPFDRDKKYFDDDEVNKFIINKKIFEYKINFFCEDNRNYWTVIIVYETVIEKVSISKEMTEVERILFDKFREWRKETAENEGIPVYIVATNNQIASIIRLRPKSLEQLKTIDGFGKKKIEKYGKIIVEKIKAFYEVDNE
jgi:superfamily II DNA helicase RecQ